MDEKAVKDYLQKNKYLDEKSVKLIKEEDLIEIKKEMKAEFKREKEALVDRMNKLIKDREVQEKNKGEIDFDLKDTKDTIDQIEIGLKTRAKEYTQLLHFNNIVSGFLDITRADDVEETATERVKISNKSKLQFAKKLKKIGYCFSKRKKADFLKITKAFQRHYRQELINGIIDMECLIIAKKLSKNT